MTIKELSNVYYIGKEIARFEAELVQLRNEAERITPTLSSQPKGNGKSDKVGKNATEIADLQIFLEAKRIERLQEQRKLYEYINGIPDALTRLIFQYRFIDCLTWNEVADKIGGNHNEKSVSMIVYRYLRGATK